MKDKIIVFLIGLLLGAIISTGSIYIYSVATNDSHDMKMPSGMGNQNGQNQDGQTPREMPNNTTNSSDTTQSNN